MNFKRNLWKMMFGCLFFCFILVSNCTPIYAYNFGDWDVDGYVQSRFGLFTQEKPFNQTEFGGSNDNIATARQQFRLNLNGQISQKIGLKAEILAAWEPEYPHEKGTGIPANEYSSFDWRELTIEYKPDYAHTIRFGRQIINWGEALSGRVVDQCNPTDSRYLLGFLDLEEIYMPLWMFRGIHDFYNWNTTIEWIAAPIWQADRYEHGRRMTAPGYRSGDGDNYGRPWARFASNPESRVKRYSGAETAISLLAGTPASIFGPPYATGYHGSDLFLTPGPIQPLTSGQAASLLPASAAPYIRDANILWTELPSADGSMDARYNAKYTDHNFKNTRWGIKTKHIIKGAEVGLSFYQGPAHSGSFHYRERLEPYGPGPIGFLVYEYVVPRYNTFGLFGNYQLPWAIVVFEGAYRPDREFHKNLYGLPIGTAAQRDDAHLARLDNVVEKDFIHTLLGITREQRIPFLNKYNVFTIRTQWQAYWFLQDMDDVAEVTTYFNTPEQINHEFYLSISTAYSYNKYRPGLTFTFNPRGQLYSNASFTWYPEGFNSKLSVNIGYTNIWGANEYSTSTVYAAYNDLAVLSVRYTFY